MKVMIMLILCFWLLPADVAGGNAEECYECWDNLDVCVEGGGSKCCEKQKRKYCRGCDDVTWAYLSCIARVDPKETYGERSIKKKVNGFRQRFLDELDGMLDE